MSFQDDHDSPVAIEDSLLTSAEARENYIMWKDAHEGLAFAQSYSIGDRSLTKADAPEVRDWMDYWARQWFELRRREKGARSTLYSVADFRSGPV